MQILGRKIVKGLCVAVSAIALVVVGASFYMLGHSLTPDEERGDVERAYARLYERVPDMKPWVDSLRSVGALRDTFVVMPHGGRAHAYYVCNDSARGRTAVVVHGYKDTAITFLYLGRMYYRDFGFNILLPDLYAHGLSDGDAIQMGWKDRLDVIEWLRIAERLFRTEGTESSVVVHGVSMGAATTMCVSGEELPHWVKCFVEDCGYTSAWDEFSMQLRSQFGLPDFPLMYTTSLLCRLRYGWSFGEASPLEQVKKCRRPMLFIHGASDTFVPTSMVYPLYEAKPGEKRLWIAPGSEHARAYIDHPAEYTRVVGEFLR